MKTNSRLRTILGHLRKFENPTATTLSSNECAASLPIVQDREFQYTLNCSLLSREQRQFYEDNGYLLIKKLVHDDILDSCRDHFVDICNGVKPESGMFLMREPTLFKGGVTGEYLYYKIQDLLYDKVFAQYSFLPQLLDYVQCFSGPNITALNSMLINKPPNVPESTHAYHQDLLYFPIRPVNLMVGTWTAMETVNAENGCLLVVPGSHKSGQLYRHDSEHIKSRAYKTFYGAKNMQNLHSVPLIMEKGDTVFIHPLLLHGSGPNKSKGFRKAISTHYVASECEMIESNGHDHVAQDIVSTALKRTGIAVDYITAMKLRSVVVRGAAGFTAM